MRALPQKLLSIANPFCDAQLIGRIWARCGRHVLENWAFKPCVVYIEECLQTWQIGRVLSFSLIAREPHSTAEGWRADAAGALLLDVGVHYIRALRVLFGEANAVEDAHVEGGCGVPGPHRVSGRLLFGNGVGGQIELSFGGGAATAAADDGAQKELTIVGDSGAICWDIRRATVQLTCAGETREEHRKDPWVQGGVHDALLDALRSVAASISTDDSVPAAPPMRCRTSAADAVRDLALFDALMRSADADGARRTAHSPPMALASAAVTDASRSWRFTPALHIAPRCSEGVEHAVRLAVRRSLCVGRTGYPDAL